MAFVAAAAQPLADDEMEQYKRTLSKRHPNRGTDEVRKMAREHMAATRVGRVMKTHLEMAKWLLEQPGNADKSNVEMADEMSEWLSRENRLVPDRRSLFVTLSKARKYLGSLKTRRAPKTSIAEVELDFTRMSLSAVARWLVSQGDNRLRKNADLQDELLALLLRNGRGSLSLEHAASLISKARGEMTGKTGTDFSAPLKR